MSESNLRIGVIIGSTREGRFGDTVARWFGDFARRRGDMDVDVIDLAEAGLPAIHRQERPPAVQEFAERVAAADAFVVITPEYNHAYPASLKLAIDWLKLEWRRKPVAFVSYGGISGGLRAVEQLRLVFAELHAMTVRDTVSFHMARGQFDDAGQPKDAAVVERAATIMLDEVAWWARALRDARLRSAA
ncbi:MAG TPA: NAD(P)H-dependent oxidoreductase [Gemmatimonadaceae bacterium]|nr:NAD(P)H-dependent oxidoreductase [Gemmatimonadaceae bacterium]